MKLLHSSSFETGGARSDEGPDKNEQPRSSAPDVFAFEGRTIDPASELQWHRLRHYDPTVGQWLSEEPPGFAAGDENLRRYVGQ